MRPRPQAAGFLAASGWGDALVSPLAGDASFRRYFRVGDGVRQAVLMDAPPEHEDVRPFAAMSGWLRDAGFAAPEIFARDDKQGFLLIEDFGDRLLGPELAAGHADETASYTAAIELLAELHRAAPPAFLAPYDRAQLLREVALFPQWYAKAVGVEVDDARFNAAWDAVLTPVLAETLARPVVTLRDYHVENLLLLDRPGVQSLGLLDFQDALAGHPGYDLVSLLQDARRDVPPALERAMFHHFTACADIDPGTLRAAYEVLGAQRNVKILGIFVRLRDRDGRKGYVERLPRVWGYLERNFAHPALQPVKQWFDQHIPQAERAARWK
ncbi:MAG: phosphotransferase [Sphingomonadaceae bacterium]